MVSRSDRNRRWLCVLLVLGSLAAGPALAQVVVEAEQVPGHHDPDKQLALQQERAAWLLGLEAASQPAGLKVQIAQEARDQLAAPVAEPGPLLVGVIDDTAIPIRFGGLAGLGGASGIVVKLGIGSAQVRDDLFVWHTRIVSPGATALRLHLTDVVLPDGAAIWVYSTRGEAFGPYTSAAVLEDGLWTNTILGDELRLQVHLRGADLGAALESLRADISGVGHLGERFLLGGAAGQAATDAHCPANASCVENASCSSIPSAIQPARDAVGRMLYSSGGGQYLCSGGLLNDTDSSSTIPYFITANHCISTQSEASSLEVYFQYSSSCGGSCPSPSASGAPRVTGSTLLNTSSTSDYTLLRLDQSAPGGSTLLGWTSAAVAFSNNTSLYRVSHPKGQPQAYSEHRVDTSKGTCGAWPRGDWIYSHDTYGATEGGSSGSPVLNGSGQVVGQLSGACGTNPSNPCASNSNATVDGAFAAYYDQISNWLDPTPGSCHVGSNGSADYCSSSCPCDAGEGDCDSNAECASGLTCVTDVGPNYGFASWVDVCEAPSSCHVGALGSADYCSNSCPCADGEGDCDSDAQCESGLTCVDNVGPNYGWASWVDVCEDGGGGSNPNSCVGNCGAQAPGGCWCDSSCTFYGDCCSDKTAVCG